MFGFKRKPKFDIDDLKAIRDTFKEEAPKGKAGKFLDEMRQYKALEREMKADEQDKIQEILEQYGNADDSGGESVEDMAVKQLIPILLKKFGGGATAPNEQQTLINQIPYESPPISADQGILSPEQINDIALQMGKKFKSDELAGLKQLSGADIKKIIGAIKK